MLDINDFSKKQIIVYVPHMGDKLSYKNDNIIISDKAGKIKYQHTCYRIFMVLVIGDASITTGLLRRAKKFGFSILFLSYSFKLYAEFNAGLQGNTYLHKKQYLYEGSGLANYIIINKINNQKAALMNIRGKSEYIKDGIKMLDEYIKRLKNDNMDKASIIGIEGNASKVYFSRMFDNKDWNGRKPRIKIDYINSLMDIGYTILFNFIDCILMVYGFDVYQGVLHTNFYMRKSLVCDLMEPFRPIIDCKIRKGINLGQFKKDDFTQIKERWELEYKKSAIYCSLFLEEILNYKEAIFLFVRGYYRAFMKEAETENYPMFDAIRKTVFYSQCGEYNDNN